MNDTTGTTTVGMSAVDLEAQIQEVKDIACTLITFAGSGNTLGEVVGFDMAIDKIGNRLLDVGEAIEKAGYGLDGRPTKTTQEAPQVDFKAHEEARHRVEGATNMLFGMAESGLAMQPETAAGLQDIAEMLSNATCDMYRACHAPEEI